MCQLFKQSHCLTKWTFWLKIYFCKQRWGGRKLIVERHLFDLIKSIRRIPKVHCLCKTTLWVRHGINNKPHIYWFIHFIHSFVLALKSPIGEVVNLAYMYTYIHTTLLVGVYDKARREMHCGWTLQDREETFVQHQLDEQLKQEELRRVQAAMLEKQERNDKQKENEEFLDNLVKKI